MNCSKIYKIFLTALIAFLLGLLLGVSASSPSSDKAENNTSEETSEPGLMVKESVTVKELGEFVITAYCPCESCSDEYGFMTSTGVIATEGRTVAVDPKVIPYGTEVIIDGHTYVAEDCGGAIKQNKIDIFFENHEDTEDFGKQSSPVSIIVRSDKV